jgi:hypothetical protein
LGLRSQLHTCATTCARACHITLPTPATCAPDAGPPCPTSALGLCPAPCHICAETGLTPPTSSPALCRTPLASLCV